MDGTIVSSSGNSSNESEEKSEVASSETEMEAPLRKKSKTHPGAVLSMLINHIRDQMDQSALTEVGQESNNVTGGIKVMSFFNLFVKTAYPNHLKELREVHHTATVLDILRQGDVAKVGDTLAARFMAIHQSLVDGGWGTARHLELFPMIEPTAAGSAMLLATRKHARMESKAAGYLPLGGGNTSGKGRGGKGRGDWYQSDQKGERGEGKGKGKNKKGKNRWSKGDNTGKDWEKTKEKPEEKGK